MRTAVSKTGALEGTKIAGGQTPGESGGESGERGRGAAWCRSRGGRQMSEHVEAAATLRRTGEVTELEYELLARTCKDAEKVLTEVKAGLTRDVPSQFLPALML